ncbi:NYN domain-containing protein [Roseiconus nitratireducens]|uniref:NYN domain-containing protein n=1 Tax=Roseiconus nitratireducens TaxID=2605748 RepID=A0A5M6DDR2_9BACT|nr:NYN domain-containing protein [Roseiconus nitratireducens]KAA5544422.1 NYN domain-containing protein [Roseiconus nitratireducens]
MSLLLLIDGYNLSQPIAPSSAPPPGWLENNRRVLLRDLTNHLPDAVRDQTCVVFDAADPPRDRPDRYTQQGIDIQFAVRHASADELLQEIIRAHHTPKRLMVVSSDHQVQLAAKRRGAKFFDSQPWLDDLTDGKLHLAVKLPQPPGNPSDQDGGAGQGTRQKPGPVAPEEVSDWLREFGFED